MPGSYKSSVDYSKLLKLTPREEKYGVQFFETEQPVIRTGYDYTVSQEKVNANRMLYRYGAFLYHAMRAAAFTASLSMIGAPWIRPGFNMWIDPVGLDKIFYVMSVQHQGSYDGGVYTSVGLNYGRDRRTFLMNKWFKLGKNVFLGDPGDDFSVDNFSDKVIASVNSNYGRTEMKDMTDRLKQIRSSASSGKLINVNVDKDGSKNPYYDLYKEHPVKYDSVHFNRLYRDWETDRKSVV